MIIELIVPVLTLFSIGTLGWAVQISSRITKIETKQEDLPTLINAKFNGMDDKFDGIEKRLERIERAMNGALYGKH